ncbi:MAG: hypothetical protein HY071_04800, partial [Chloroflexi bacterium]|nr:hypothetical protein [Chloroflexota bacterium]
LTAIWMGNSDNSEMQGISSALGPGVLWRDYMKTVVGGLPPDGFPRPDGIVDAVVCINPSLTGGQGSGKLPGAGCPGSWRKTEHFKAGTQPTNSGDFFGPGGCINLRAPFSDWQKDYVAWARSYTGYGRFSWSFCGIAPPSPTPCPSGATCTPAPCPADTTCTPSPSPSGSGTPTPQPSITPQPTPPPRPTPPPPTRKP